MDETIEQAIRRVARITGGADIAAMIAAGIEAGLAQLGCLNSPEHPCPDVPDKSGYGVPRGHTDACWKRTDGLCECGAYMGVSPAAVPPYGAPGCDCPLPEKVSEDCPIHGTPRNAGYGVLETCLCRGSEEPHQLYSYGCVGPVQHSPDSVRPEALLVKPDYDEAASGMDYTP